MPCEGARPTSSEGREDAPVKQGRRPVQLLPQVPQVQRVQQQHQVQRRHEPKATSTASRSASVAHIPLKACMVAGHVWKRRARAAKRTKSNRRSSATRVPNKGLWQCILTDRTPNSPRDAAMDACRGSHLQPSIRTLPLAQHHQAGDGVILTVTRQLRSRLHMNRRRQVAEHLAQARHVLPPCASATAQAYERGIGARLHPAKIEVPQRSEAKIL